MQDILNAAEIDGQRYLCITRLRHFGTSVMANMVGAFLGKASDSNDVSETVWGNLHAIYERT